MDEITLIATWSNGEPAHRIPLFGQTIRIGHDPYSDIILPLEFVPHAPFHAAVQRISNDYYIYDPENVGTLYDDGKPILQRYKLKLSKPVTVGHPSHLHLRIRLEQIEATQAISLHSWEAPTVSMNVSEAMQAAGLDDPRAAYLRAGWSAGESTIFKLEQDTTLVGRSPLANVQLPDDLRFVSGLHFQIVRQGGRYLIADKDSTNGTRLNRRKLVSNVLHPLNDGDVISLHGDQRDAMVWFIFTDPRQTRVIEPDLPAPVAADGFNLSTQQELEKPQTLWNRIRRFLGSE